MGDANLTTEESWLAARKIVRRFEGKFGKDEIVEAFKAIQALVFESMWRLLNRRVHELRRLNRRESPLTPDHRENSADIRDSPQE